MNINCKILKTSASERKSKSNYIWYNFIWLQVSYEKSSKSCMHGMYQGKFLELKIYHRIYGFCVGSANTIKKMIVCLLIFMVLIPARFINYNLLCILWENMLSYEPHAIEPMLFISISNIAGRLNVCSGFHFHIFRSCILCDNVFMPFGLDHKI